MPPPGDAQELASYLSSANRGGKGQNGNFAQKDAIAGTRFANTDDKGFDLAVARGYAAQFAAQATGNDPGSVQGLQAGMQNFNSMSPDAKAFM